MADGELTGKAAVVTGSGRNIGRAIVLELAAAGAHVVVNARSGRAEAEETAAAARSYGVDARVVVGDVTLQTTIDALVDVATEAFGGVDIAVSNAAVRPHQAFSDISADDWHAVMTEQLSASFRLAQAVAPGMRERGWGRIIHISGPSAFVALPNRAHAVTSKGALHALTKALAVEFGPHGITVNDIAPGAIGTVDNERSHPRSTDAHDGAHERDRRWAIPSVPVGRLGTPSDVAYAAGFLASPRASFVTGTTMCCFGGQWNVP